MISENILIHPEYQIISFNDWSIPRLNSSAGRAPLSRTRLPLSANLAFRLISNTRLCRECIKNSIRCILPSTARLTIHHNQRGLGVSLISCGEESSRYRWKRITPSPPRDSSATKGSLNATYNTAPTFASAPGQQSWVALTSFIAVPLNCLALARKSTFLSLQSEPF